LAVLKNPLWGSDWPEVRRQWGLDPNVAHLNHGSFGAVPIPVQTVQDRIRAETEANPNAFLDRILTDRAEEARLATARFLNADPDGFVFVRNATTGVNTVLASLELRPGDQVLITDHLYGAMRLAAERTCERAGTELAVQPVPLPWSTEDLAEAVLAGVNRRTALAIIDHIASPTGVVFPVGELVAGLRARGVRSLIDGAHAPGMVDVDLAALDPDFWTGNFHKWCSAPRGAAGLYVRKEHRERTTPLVASWDVREGFTKAFGWLGTDDYSAYLSVPAAIEFLAGLGWDRLRSHNRELARLGGERLADAMGTQPVDGPFEAMTLVALPPDTVTTEDEAQALSALVATDVGCEVAITVWAGRGFLRLSAQAYNAPAEYERLAEGLKRVLGR
jgi:isopenicillin-N epimerase